MFVQLFEASIIIQLCFLVQLILICIFLYFIIVVYARFYNLYGGYEIFMKHYSDIENMPNTLELENPIYSIFKNCICIWGREIKKDYKERIDISSRTFYITQQDWLESTYIDLAFLKNLLSFVWLLFLISCYICIFWLEKSLFPFISFNAIIIIIMSISIQILELLFNSWKRKLQNFFDKLINDLTYKE